MSVKVIRLAMLSTVATIIAAAAIFSAVALGSQRPRPDVRVISGAAKVTTGMASKGRAAPSPVISGSFKVHNAGTATAPHFRGWVKLTAPKRAVLIRDYLGGKLQRGHTVTLTLHRDAPTTLAKVNWTIEACVVLGTKLSAKPARDGCRRLGTYTLAPAAASIPVATVTNPTTVGSPTTTVPTTSTPSTTTATPAPVGPASQVPTDPVSDYRVDQPFFEADGLGQNGQYEGTPNAPGASETNPYSGGFFTSGYWVDVPWSYDETNQTPETLLVYMHGCGGVAYDDLEHITSEYSSDRPYIAISINGPEDASAGDGPDCWDTSDQTDVTKVLTDIAQVESEFNIDRHRVIIAGYSSGGDLAYQTIFLHADTFAGILAVNTDPVRDNTFDDSTSAAITAASWKFPIVHLAHLQDETYPISGVSTNVNALKSAGFPVTLDEVSGTHYNDEAPDGCYGNGDPSADPPVPACTSGTYYDMYSYLFSTIATDGWESPAS